MGQKCAERHKIFEILKTVQIDKSLFFLKLSQKTRFTAYQLRNIE